MISGPIFSQKNIGGFHILELYQGATTLFEDSSLWGSWRFPNWRILRLAASHFSSKLTEKMVSWAFGAPKFLGLQQSTSQVATTVFWSECRLTSFCCFCPGYGHLENFNWPWKTMENPAFMDCPLNPLKIGISHWQLKWPAFSKFKTLMSWICFGFPSSVFWQTHFFGWFMACCSKLLLISSQFAWFTSIDGYQFFLATTIFDGHLPAPWNRRSLSSGSYWGEPQRGGVLNGDLHSGHTRYNQKFPSLLPYMVKNPPKNSEMPALERKKTWLFLIGTYWNWLRSTSGDGLSMFQPFWSPPTLDEKMETPRPTSPILTKVLVHAGALTVQRTVAGTAWVTKIRTSYPQIQ